MRFAENNFRPRFHSLNCAGARLPQMAIQRKRFVPKSRK